MNNLLPTHQWIQVIKFASWPYVAAATITASLKNFHAIVMKDPVLLLSGKLYSLVYSVAIGSNIFMQWDYKVSLEKPFGNVRAMLYC